MATLEELCGEDRDKARRAARLVLLLGLGDTEEEGQPVRLMAKDVFALMIELALFIGITADDFFDGPNVTRQTLVRYQDLTSPVPGPLAQRTLRNFIRRRLAAVPAAEVA